MSSYKPNDSQRSKHVPDVLFVDEEGNPIESGRENLVFVDESGNEVPDEVAYKLLESGLYIDSRTLYDPDIAAAHLTSVSATASSSNIDTDASQALFDPSQASLPASAFGSLRKSGIKSEFRTSNQSLGRAQAIQMQAQLQAEALAEAKAAAAAAAAAKSKELAQQQKQQAVKAQAAANQKEQVQQKQQQAAAKAREQAQQKQQQAAAKAKQLADQQKQQQQQQAALVAAQEAKARELAEQQKQQKAAQEAKARELAEKQKQQQAALAAAKAKEQAEQEKQQKAAAAAAKAKELAEQQKAAQEAKAREQAEKEKQQQAAAAAKAKELAEQQKQQKATQAAMNALEAKSREIVQQQQQQQQQQQVAKAQEQAIKSQQQQQAAKAKESAQQQQKKTIEAAVAKQVQPKPNSTNASKSQVSIKANNNSNESATRAVRKDIKKVDPQSIRSASESRSNLSADKSSNKLQASSNKVIQRSFDNLSDKTSQDYANKSYVSDPTFGLDQLVREQQELLDNKMMEKELEFKRQNQIFVNKQLNPNNVKLAQNSYETLKNAQQSNLEQQKSQTQLKSAAEFWFPSEQKNNFTTTRIGSTYSPAYEYTPIYESPEKIQQQQQQQHHPGNQEKEFKFQYTKQPGYQFPINNLLYQGYEKDYDIYSLVQLGNLFGDGVITDVSKVDIKDFERFYDSDRKEKPDYDSYIDPANPDLFKDEIVQIDYGAIDAFTEALNEQIRAEKNKTIPYENLQFPPHILTSNHATFIDNQLLLGDPIYNTDYDGTGYSSTKYVDLNKAYNSTSNFNGSFSSKLDDTYQPYSNSESFTSLVDIPKKPASSLNGFNEAVRQDVLYTAGNLPKSSVNSINNYNQNDSIYNYYGTNTNQNKSTNNYYTDNASTKTSTNYNNYYTADSAKSNNNNTSTYNNYYSDTTQNKTSNTNNSNSNNNSYYYNNYNGTTNNNNTSNSVAGIYNYNNNNNNDSSNQNKTSYSYYSDAAIQNTNTNTNNYYNDTFSKVGLNSLNTIVSQ